MMIYFTVCITYNEVMLGGSVREGLAMVGYEHLMQANNVSYSTILYSTNHRQISQT